MAKGNRKVFAYHEMIHNDGFLIGCRQKRRRLLDGYFKGKMDKQNSFGRKRKKEGCSIACGAGMGIINKMENCEKEGRTAFWEKFPI